MALSAYRGNDFAGNTIGIAFIDRMCDLFSSVGVVEDRPSRSSSQVGSTFAHELGHLLSMDHDNSQYIIIHTHIIYKMILIYIHTYQTRTYTR